MNPDSGRVHATMEAIQAAEAAAKGESPELESVKAALDRAEKKREELEAKSSVPQGAELPPDWPRFEIGEKLGPIKGWWFELVDVDLEAQELLIKPLEPTKSTKEKRAGKRRKRTKCGSRKRRKKGFR